MRIFKILPMAEATEAHRQLEGQSIMIRLSYLTVNLALMNRPGLQALYLLLRQELVYFFSLIGGELLFPLLDLRMRAIRRSEPSRSISQIFASTFTISTFSATRRPLISSRQLKVGILTNRFFRKPLSIVRFLTWAAERSNFSRLRI